jgi:hypothetical protein
MIPTNPNTINPCDPISSNCVIWQGPDLPCVDICTGDSISAIIAALCRQLVILQEIVGDGNAILFDITAINMDCLEGDPTNLNELIQIIIDYICNIESGGHTAAFDCTEVWKCSYTVPECLLGLIGNSTNPLTLSEWLSGISTILCNMNNNSSIIEEQSAAIQQRLTNIEQSPTGEMNPRLYSSGVTTKNILTPIQTIVQALDAQFIQLRGATGTASNIINGINSQPANYQTAVSSEGYTNLLNTSSVTAGDSINNLWILMDDARKAITDIQNNCCSSVQLIRMVGINAFYASGANCATALAAAVAGVAGTCTDIWNTTSVQFDPTVRAYTNPYNPSSTTELVNGSYYALCNGGPISRYSRMAPHWGTPTATCT